MFEQSAEEMYKPTSVTLLGRLETQSTEFMASSLADSAVKTNAPQRI